MPAPRRRTRRDSEFEPREPGARRPGPQVRSDRSSLWPAPRPGLPLAANRRMTASGDLSTSSRIRWLAAGVSDFAPDRGEGHGKGSRLGAESDVSRIFHAKVRWSLVTVALPVAGRKRNDAGWQTLPLAWPGK